MKIKLRKGTILPNNWKACGCSAEDWADLNTGKSIEVSSVPKLIEGSIVVLETASKPKKKEGDK